MNSAVFTDYQEIYQIKDKRVAPSSKFDEIAAKIKNTAKVVKRDWSSLSSEQQAELSNLAYTLLTPSTKPTLFKKSIEDYILLLI